MVDQLACFSRTFVTTTLSVTVSPPAISISLLSGSPAPTSSFPFASAFTSRARCSSVCPNAGLLRWSAAIRNGSISPRPPSLAFRFDRHQQLSRRSGRTDAGADPCLTPQCRARSRAHEARRLAMHAVAPAARFDARHLRAGLYWFLGRAGRQGPRHEGAGLRTKQIAGEGCGRRIRIARGHGSETPREKDARS